MKNVFIAATLGLVFGFTTKWFDDIGVASGAVAGLVYATTIIILKEKP